jgi:DNA-binding LytR/AlgR family response regulator
MQVMNCLILEDEPLAVNVLKEYIFEVPELKLGPVCEDAFSAMSALRSEKIDLLFVDINLPKLNGIDFIKSLNDNYKIILTTAYHEFALDAYNLNVIDYLVKPIEFTRFLQAINKVLSKETGNQSINHLPTERKFQFFNVDKKKVKVFLDEIVFVESLKDYVRIHLSDKKIVTKFQIGALHELLGQEKFLRVHKSYIINSDKIISVRSTEIELGSVKIPVGRMYKNEFEKRFPEFG